jgi:hypothetical protein
MYLPTSGNGILFIVIIIRIRKKNLFQVLFRLLYVKPTFLFQERSTCRCRPRKPLFNQWKKLFWFSNLVCWETFRCNSGKKKKSDWIHKYIYIYCVRNLQSVCDGWEQLYERCELMDIRCTLDQALNIVSPKKYKGKDKIYKNDRHLLHVKFDSLCVILPSICFDYYITKYKFRR